MAKLTEEEAAVLKRLQEKAKAPDAPSVARSLNISVDLGDDAQVDRAVKLGLPGFEAFASNGDGDGDGDDDGDGDGDADDDGDEPPKRRGFFPDA